MKKLAALLFFAMTFPMSFAGTSLSSAKGVWANNNAEAVITDSVCIYYAKVDSTMQATFEIPSSNIFHRTTFAKEGSVTFSTLQTPMELEIKDGNLIIGGEQLKKVEDIEIVAPYEMTGCDYTSDVGRCLQEWQLGAKYGFQDGNPYCEINTNRHMFVYMVVDSSMVYIRAAAARNNNSGTLFFQNIRMMKNLNTGEYTMRIKPNNFNLAKNDLEIDNSKFVPGKCTFSPDGGIYWSLISFKPDEILLNGCGETYRIQRPTIDAPINEWIKYKPYDEKADFSASRNHL